MARKLICFCCGEKFIDYEEYRQHIFEVHSDEEDNMWIRCPHCDFPVRDLKSHFKIKHPNLKMPKVPQVKARVWKEPKESRARRGKNSTSGNKRNWKEGYFLSPKNGGQHFHYRSSWELKVMECLEVFDDVLSWKSEPFPISYQLHGKQRMYLPDLLISYKDGSFLMVEIKPKNQCQEKMNKAKWSAAKAYCDARRWIFEVWTENYISELQQRKRAVLRNQRLKRLNPDIDIL